MKYLLAILFSALFLIGCDHASFDITGDGVSGQLSSGDIEVVSEDELLAEEINPPGEDTEDDLSDDDKDKICQEDCDKPDVITPPEIFEDDELTDHHNCGKPESIKKVFICQWPAADETKRHTLCVSQNSLASLVADRRQDHYFVGPCDFDEPVL